MNFLTVLAPILILSTIVERIASIIWTTIEGIVLGCPRVVLWLLLVVVILFGNLGGQIAKIPPIEGIVIIPRIQIADVNQVIEIILLLILVFCLGAWLLKIFKDKRGVKDIYLFLLNQEQIKAIHRVIPLSVPINVDTKDTNSRPFLDNPNYKKFKDIISTVIALIIGVWIAAILHLDLFSAFGLPAPNLMSGIVMSGVAAGAVAPYSHQVIQGIFDIRQKVKGLDETP